MLGDVNPKANIAHARTCYCRIASKQVHWFERAAIDRVTAQKRPILTAYSYVRFARGLAFACF